MSGSRQKKKLSGVSSGKVNFFLRTLSHPFMMLTYKQVNPVFVPPRGSCRCLCKWVFVLYQFFLYNIVASIYRVSSINVPVIQIVYFTGLCTFIHPINLTPPCHWLTILLVWHVASELNIDVDFLTGCQFKWPINKPLAESVQSDIQPKVKLSVSWRFTWSNLPVSLEERIHQ